VDPEQHRNVTRTDAIGHQQKGLGSPQYARLGLRRANRSLHPLTLFDGKRERLRPRTRVRARHPRFRIDHALPLQQPVSYGQIFAERY